MNLTDRTAALAAQKQALDEQIAAIDAQCAQATAAFETQKEPIRKQLDVVAVQAAYLADMLNDPDSNVPVADPTPEEAAPAPVDATTVEDVPTQ
jgi:hypothetical protein